MPTPAPAPAPQARWWLLLLCVCVCVHVHAIEEEIPFGEIRTMNADLLPTLLPSTAVLEILTETQPLGETVYEGPTWRGGADGYLLFSDVKANKILKWSSKDGLSVFLEQAGCFTDLDNCKSLAIPGTNGLATDPLTGNLLTNMHGERAVARLENTETHTHTRALRRQLQAEGPLRTIVAATYQGKRLNSPNDLTVDKNGDIYFTDPPYGLKNAENDTQKEIPFSGVYMVKGEDVQKLAVGSTEGAEVHLISKDLPRPNGLALSPDGTKLYVGESTWASPSKSAWYVFKRDSAADTFPSTPKLFVNEVDVLVGTPVGSNDGMKTDTQGNIWATGRGGILILSPEGKQLGFISTGDKHTSNLAFGNDGFLYITGLEYLSRIPVLAQGLVNSYV